MSDKETNNVFKFSLYQGDVLFCEKIFDADQYNPFTRYSVNIRELLPKSITKLQKVLSRKKYDVVFDAGNGVNYDLYEYVQKMIEKSYDIKYNPPVVVQHIDEKVIKGVEFKIGLYINGNPIVERLFYVDGFNPVSRWSYEVYNQFMEIVDDIISHIKANDIKNMWDDYDLINVRGLTINQIRELSLLKREELLRRIHRN